MHKQLQGAGNAFGSAQQQAKDWSDYASETHLLKLGWYETFSDAHALEFTGYIWRNDDSFSIDLREATALPPFLIEEQRRENHWGSQIIYRYQTHNRQQFALSYEYRSSKLSDFSASLTDSDNNLLIDNAQRPETGYQRKLHSLIIDGRQPFSTAHGSLVYGLRFDSYSDFGQQLSPRLGWLQSISPQTVVKFLYGHAYRAPYVFELYGSPVVKPNFELEAEQIDTLELIWQHSHSNGLTRITLFHSQWHDAIQQVRLAPAEGDFISLYDNAGENSAYGIELEAQLRWQQWRLDGFSSYIHSQNDDSNQRYGAFPHWMLNIGIGFKPSSSWDIYLLNRYAHRDQSATGPDTSQLKTTASKYLRLDFSIRWHAHQYAQMQLSLRNMLDRNNFWHSAFAHIDGIADTRRALMLEIDFNL